MAGLGEMQKAYLVRSFESAAQHARRKLVSLLKSLGFETTRQVAIEGAVFAAVCIAAAVWAIVLLSHFDFLRVCRGFDLWFDSDPARTVSNIVARYSTFHNRSHLHPVYSLLFATPFVTISKLFGLPTSTVTMLYVGLQSALYAGAAYLAMRAFGLLCLDAILGVLLIYSTAACMYWIGFPETFAFGAATMLASVIWIAGPPAIRNHVTGVAQNFLSGSVLITNWAAGVVASLVSDWPKLRWDQVYTQTRDALALMSVLVVVQHLLFPFSGSFLSIWHEIFRAVDPDTVKPSKLQLLLEIITHTLVAPNAAIRTGVRDIPGWGVLITTAQGQAVHLSALTVTIFALWVAAWALGVYAAVRGGVRKVTSMFVVGVLGYLFVVHILFGGEVFLFSLHFAPFMAFVALWGVHSRYKLLARCVCVALIAASTAYNYPAFTSAVGVHNQIDLSWLDREHAASLTVASLDCR